MKQVLVLFLFFVFPRLLFAIGIIDFREMYESLKMGSHLGPQAESRVLEIFNRIKQQLPKHGKLHEYNWSVQKNLFTLSSSFCKEMIDMDRGQSNPENRWAHTEVDFTKGPNSFGQLARSTTLNNYAKLYWGRDLLESELEHYLKLFDEVTSEEPDLPSKTILLCLVGCTAVSGAPDFWVKP